MRKREVIGPRNTYNIADDRSDSLEVNTKMRWIGIDVILERSGS
jgi:hypothetical protein